MVSLEMNARIFKGISSSLDNIWDGVTLLALMWCYANNGLFRCVSLVDMQRVGPILCYGSIS